MKRSITDLEKYKYKLPRGSTVTATPVKIKSICNLPFEIAGLISEYISLEQEPDHSRYSFWKLMEWHVIHKIGVINGQLDMYQKNAIVAALGLCVRPADEIGVVVLGPPGTGKSVCIVTLRRCITWMGGKAVTVAKSALAAANVGGITIERCFGKNLFHLRSIWNAVTRQPRAGFKVKRRYEHVYDFIIIDEASMVSDVQLEHIIYLAKASRIILFGDLFQLPPVENHPLFIDSTEIFKFTIERLRVPFRQSGSEGRRYRELIENVGYGNCEEAWKVIKERVIAWRALSPPQLAKILHICSTNKRAAALNNHFYAMNIGEESCYPVPEPRFVCVERIRRKGVTDEGKPTETEITDDLAIQTLKKALCKRVFYSGGESMKFKVGTRVMVTLNNDRFKLYNGELYVIAALHEGSIDLCETESGRVVEVPLVELKIILSSNSINRSTSITQIEEVAYLKFFPLTLAHAITVHKAQGQTLQEVVIDINSSFGRGLEYVAISRCKKLENMYISSFPVVWQGAQ